MSTIKAESEFQVSALFGMKVTNFGKIANYGDKTSILRDEHKSGFIGISLEESAVKACRI